MEMYFKLDKLVVVERLDRLLLLVLREKGSVCIWHKIHLIWVDKASGMSSSNINGVALAYI